jgi:Tfp pilus assembly protein PilW
MRRRRGFSIVEIMVGLTLLTMTLIGVVALFIGGFRSYYRTSAKVELAQKNAQGIRLVSDSLKSAMNVAVSADGKTITYNLPLKSVTPDPTTGEREFIDPLVSDGINRTFTVDIAGRLTDGTARTFVSKIASIDPDPASSTYNQTYQPFTLTAAGSIKTLTINLITSQRVGSTNHYARMKTTVLLRNAK